LLLEIVKDRASFKISKKQEKNDDSKVAVRIEGNYSWGLCDMQMEIDSDVEEKKRNATVLKKTRSINTLSETKCCVKKHTGGSGKIDSVCQFACWKNNYRKGKVETPLITEPVSSKITLK
jgi:hypothetical protein